MMIWPHVNGSNTEEFKDKIIFSGQDLSGNQNKVLRKIIHLGYDAF